MTQPIRPAQSPTQIQLKGFTNSINDLDMGAFMTVGYGPEFTGKSSFGLTMPTPLAVIQNDPKTSTLIHTKLVDMGIDASKVFVSRYISRVEETSGTHWVARDKKDLESQEFREQLAAYRRHVEEEKRLIIDAASHPDIVSIMIDSGTILYEDILHAMFGRTSNVLARDKAQAAAEFMGLLQILSSKRTRTGRRKHVYITARLVDEYINDKKTGITRPEGCGKLGYFIKTQIRFNRLNSGGDLAQILSMKPGTNPNAYKIGDYMASIEKSLVTPHLAGSNGIAQFTNDNIHYGSVMSYLHPHEDPMEFFDAV